MVAQYQMTPSKCRELPLIDPKCGTSNAFSHFPKPTPHQILPTQKVDLDNSLFFNLNERVHRTMIFQSLLVESHHHMLLFSHIVVLIKIHDYVQG